MKRLPALLLVLAACDEPFHPPPLPPQVASVTVTPGSATLVAGDTVQLAAVVRDSTGAPITGVTILWSSRDSLIARVSSAGAAHAVNSGTVQIVATAGGKADSTTLTVVPIQLVAVSAGGTHTCALANNRRAYCWGYDYYGQGGIGNLGFVLESPAATAGGRTYATLALGADHSCALGTDSVTYCWGRNSAGQLGRGASPGDPSVPAPVTGSPTHVAVSAGGQHTCALTADSLAFCWGLDAEGQLGDSQTVNRAAPDRVTGGGRPFGAIAAGDAHTCGLAAGGAAYCWGRNADGQVGDNTMGSFRRYPVPVSGGHTFVAIAAGAAHTCALAADSTAWCWGDNARGQLGAGPGMAGAASPVAVSGTLRFRALDAGGAHSCALATDSTAYCWGANDKGQLGDSSTADRTTPVAVTGGLKFVGISAGGQHTCGMATDGTAYCWGSGGSGELGTGLKNDSPAPLPVAGQP